MDSPETTLPAPSAPNAAGVSPPGVQESPFLTYVNTFSPIKVPSSLRAPSTIRELNFPSPSPVFTSPHLNPVHKDKLLKRCSDSRKFSLDYACDIREQLEKASHYGGEISQSIFFPCSTNTVRGQNTQIQSSSSPSDCVDDFLADPVEDSCNTPALSNLCLSQALTDVSGQCEGSTSLPIVSHLEGDRPRKNSFDNFTTMPAISDMGAEPIKTDELEIIESLTLPSHNGENPDAGVPLVQICEQGVDLMDADDNVCKSDEVKVSERMEGGSQIRENDGSVIAFDSSGHNNVDLIERDINLEMQPKSLGAHPEEMSLVSKSQWVGCQLAYAMRRRLEFVPSSAPAMKLGSSKNPSNLRSDITVDQRIPEAKSPTNSFDLEMQKASRGQPIRASENTIAYSSPGGSFFKNDQDSSMQETFKSPTFAEGNLNRSDSSVPRPAGIGLHLNSIGKALSNNGKLSTQSVDIDQGNNSDFTTVPQQLGVIGSGSNVNSSGHLDGNSQTALNCCSIDKTEEDEQNNLDITVPNLQSSLRPTYVDQFMTPGELIELSPKKKSKKSPENDRCKRCNCKKSKCLKLYCDCFAAGVYCTDTCSCQGCLNRLEHKDIVMETRQQIENRNPLAFAPKVVVHDTLAASKPSGDADKHTPASARHKRGCNCKRSQCLKKYCECFQSKVGCSLGCRCEGCKNTYGRKEGSANSENELIKKTWNEKHRRGYYVIADEEDTDVVDLPKHSMSICLSPLTPLVDGSNAMIQSKSQFLYLKYQSSPESSVSREGKNSHDMADTEATDIFSPKWDRLGDTIIIPGGAKVNAPPVQRTSPMTPTPRFGQTRFALESSSSDCGPVNIDEDDNTPDILLRNDLQPGNGPRVGSPNKKRVSPPHHHHQLEEGSSRSMKSRKFILKSVPSFPSLTPYSNDCKTQPP